MAKCGDCGRPINPRRGYCTYFVCHNKAIGGATPDPNQQKTRTGSRRDFKRCPYCSGERTGKASCYVSACDRGPNGTSCGCHFLQAGMGTPGQEMRAILQQARRAPAIQARHLGVEAGGGARILG